MITIDNPAAFVNGEAAIGVSIVSNTKSSSVFNHGSLQSGQMSRAITGINVGAVWVSPNNDHLRSRITEGLGRYGAGCAVCAVNNDLHAIELGLKCAEEVHEVPILRICKPGHLANLATQWCEALAHGAFNLVF